VTFTNRPLSSNNQPKLLTVPFPVQFSQLLIKYRFFKHIADPLSRKRYILTSKRYKSGISLSVPDFTLLSIELGMFTYRHVGTCTDTL